MTTTTIDASADTRLSAPATRGKTDVWAEFYAQVNSYDEPLRPSVDDVAAAAAAVRAVLDLPLNQLEYALDGTPGLVEGRTFRLGISPGGISCRSTDLSRANSTLDQLPAKRSRNLDMLNAFRVDLDTGEISDELPDLDGPSRSEITEWSSKSRANMVRTLRTLDYSDTLPRACDVEGCKHKGHEIPEDGGEPKGHYVGGGWPTSQGSLAMVTLTLPGKWEILTPDGATFKTMIEKFRRRWSRAVGPWTCLWKLEFQRRGAPHWHGLLRVPALVTWNGGYNSKLGYEMTSTFEEWLAWTWADVVGASEEPDGEYDGRPDSERARHYRAHYGHAIDFSGKDFSDPRRIAMYFLGHSAKTQDDKEYQHIVPKLWRRPGKGPGRFWGFCGLNKAEIELDLTQRDYDRLRRELRKMARARSWEVAVKRQHGREHRAGVPAALFTSRARIDAPKLRRSQLGGGGGQNGGWVLLNDGLAVAEKLAAHLSTPNNGSWDGLLEPSWAGARKRFATGRSVL